MRTILTRALGALLLVGGAACSDPSGIETATPVAAVTLSAESSTLVVGEALVLQATPRDASGAPLAGRSVAWSSEAAAVASVDAAGRVLAVAPGTTRVRATSETRAGYATIVVTAPPPPPPVVASLTLDAGAVLLDEGATRTLVATPRDADGATIPGLAVQWTSSAANVAAVSATGVVTAVGMGRATITAAVNGTIAQAAVAVRGSSAFDLLFDHWTTGTGPVWPTVARLDLRDPDAAPVSIVQVAGTSQPATSPDGTRIAYVCGGTHICAVDANGQNLAMLTIDGTVLADQPAWSPDGSRIAFRGWAPGGPPGPFNPSRIWVMNADGSGKASLTTGAAGWQESPTWSPRQPDGSYRIAYSQQSQSGPYIVAHIASMRADGSDVRPVTAAGERLDDAPAWSPDGQTIAFVRTGGEIAGDVWLAQATGGNERPLMAADPAGAQRAPAWSPDGTMIAFASNHDLQGSFYTWQIFTVRVDGTQLTRRTDDPAEKQNPAWIRRAP